jgi:hypothetical protein
VEHSDAPVQAPPQYSPDGQWFWTGTEWVSAPPVPAPASFPLPTHARTGEMSAAVAASTLAAVAYPPEQQAAPFTFPTAWPVLTAAAAPCPADQHCLQRGTSDGFEQWRCTACGETRRPPDARLRPSGSWCFGCQKRLDDWGSSEVTHYRDVHGRQICRQCTGAALTGSLSCRGHQPPPATVAAPVAGRGASSSRASHTAPAGGATRWLAVAAAASVLTAGATAIRAVAADHHRGSSTARAAAPAQESSTNFDVRTTSCADYNGYSDDARLRAGHAMLTVMARNEGIKVTDAVNNEYIVQLNNACAANPTSLLAVAASAAYTQATGG